MGGHGGLNILPQKRWNVYNWDNRERVRRDEQEAARQQQEQREQEESEQREARLTELRRRSGLPDTDPAQVQAHEPAGEATEEKVQAGDAEPEEEKASTSINQHNIEELFDNTPMGLASGKRRRLQHPEQPKKVKKKTLKEQQEQAGDDDRYRLAYSREGSKQPWYMVAHSTSGSPPRVEHGVKRRRQADGGQPRKKSIEELRAERLEREEKERKRAQGLITGPPVNKRRYNSSYL